MNQPLVHINLRDYVIRLCPRCGDDESINHTVAVDSATGEPSHMVCLWPCNHERRPGETGCGYCAHLQETEEPIEPAGR